MSLLLFFAGSSGYKSGVSRLGGILIQEEIFEETNDDDEVFAIIKKIILSGILDETD